MKELRLKWCEIQDESELKGDHYPESVEEKFPRGSAGMLSGGIL